MVVRQMFHIIVTVNEMQVRLMPEKKQLILCLLEKFKESSIHVLWTWRKLCTDYQGKRWNE